MELDACFHKTCKNCGELYLTDQPRKRFCVPCAEFRKKQQSEIHNNTRKRAVATAKDFIPEKDRPKKPPDTICQQAKSESLTYGKYLEKHGLYTNVDNVVETHRNLLTFNELKALADAAGLSYREYMLRK